MPTSEIEGAEAESILVSVEDRIGTISFNRPGALNTFNLPMASQFLLALSDLQADGAVRAIVLRGEGRVFSAGGDVKEMMANVRGAEDPAAYFRKPLASFGEMVLALRRVHKPVLAAVHGAVAGVAFNVMLACDLAVAAESTHFTQAFARIGLSPDGGGTWYLPRLVGAARAAELTLLPTELDAVNAREWGLVNWVVSDERFHEKVREIAGRLARGPSQAMARAKSLLNGAWGSSLNEQLEAERLAQVANATSPDFEEGLSAFLEKREPEFQP